MIIIIKTGVFWIPLPPFFFTRLLCREPEKRDRQTESETIPFFLFFLLSNFVSLDIIIFRVCAMYHFAPTTPVQQQLQEQQQQEDLLDFFIPFDQAQAQAQPQPQPQQPATLLANDWLFQPPTLLQYDASMVSPPTPQGDRTATNRTLDEEPTTTTTATAAVAAVYEPSRDVFGNWSLLSSDHQFGLNFDKDYQGLGLILYTRAE